MTSRGHHRLFGGSDSDSEAEQRNPMEAMFAKLTAKMDAFMQDVNKKMAEKEPPRVFQVGEGSGVSSHIPDAIPIVSAQRVNSTPTRPTMPTFPV